MTPRRVRTLLVLGALFALALALTTAWAVHERREGDGIPVLVHNRIVDPWTGRVLGVLPVGAHAAATPCPGRPGVFSLEERLVATREGGADLVEPMASVDGDAVVQKDPGGAVRWTTRLHGQPHVCGLADDRVLVLVADAGRPEDDAMLVLDRASGRELWRVSGDRRREPILVRGLVVAVESGGLVGRRAATGAVAFVASSASTRDPEGVILTSMDGTILVSPRTAGDVALHDLTGLRLGAWVWPVYAVLPTPLGPAVVSDTGLALYPKDGAPPAWSNGDLRAEVGPRGYLDPNDVTALVSDAEDILVVGASTSEGFVRLVRVATRDGRTKWKTRCGSRPAPAPETHGAFAYVSYAQLRGTRIVVVSQGPDDGILELLDAVTGESLKRWVYRG